LNLQAGPQRMFFRKQELEVKAGKEVIK